MGNEAGAERAGPGKDNYRIKQIGKLSVHLALGFSELLQFLHFNAVPSEQQDFTAL